MSFVNTSLFLLATTMPGAPGTPIEVAEQPLLMAQETKITSESIADTLIVPSLSDQYELLVTSINNERIKLAELKDVKEFISYESRGYFDDRIVKLEEDLTTLQKLLDAAMREARVGNGSLDELNAASRDVTTVQTNIRALHIFYTKHSK